MDYGYCGHGVSDPQVFISGLAGCNELLFELREVEKHQEFQAIQFIQRPWMPATVKQLMIDKTVLEKSRQHIHTVHAGHGIRSFHPCFVAKNTRQANRLTG